MGDMMTFPKTVDEFMEEWKITDTEEVYTNGTEFVPIFRMKQWFDHVRSNDTIDRQGAIEALRDAQHRFTVADESGGIGTIKWSEVVIDFTAAEKVLSDLPSAEPERKTGRWIPAFGGEYRGGAYWFNCSECGKIVPGGLSSGKLYCERCGARMQVRCK